MPLNEVSGVFFLLLLVVHAIFALGVWNDASRRETTWFAPPLVWAFTVFVGGLFGVVAYWILHASNLGPEIVYKEDRMRDRIQRAIEEEGTKNRDTDSGDREEPSPGEA